MKPQDALSLTVKEKRYLDYIERCFNEDRNPTIGDICRDCHTTPLILLGKTAPSIKRKAEAILGLLELGVLATSDVLKAVETFLTGLEPNDEEIELMGTDEEVREAAKELGISLTE